MTDRDRLGLVASDVIAALEEGRFPLVLSDRKDHLESLLAEVTAMQGEKTTAGFLITRDTKWMRRPDYAMTSGEPSA